MLLIDDVDTGKNEIIVALQQNFWKLEEEIKDLDRRWKAGKVSLEDKYVELSSKLQEENGKIKVELKNNDTTFKLKI